MTGSAAHPVVVLGAGPAGVVAALLLSQQGVPVLVLDRWSSVYPQPRAVHLDDEVYRLLGRLGLAGAFAAISRPALGLRALSADHRVLAEFSRSEATGVHGYPQASMFDQPDLEAALRADLQQRPEVTFRGDVEITGLSTSPGGSVRVELQDRLTGVEEHVTAEYVLGCDGANSLVRQVLGIGVRDLGFAQRWLVVDVATTAEMDAWEGVHQVCDPRRAGTYMRIGTTRYRWEFQLLAGESAADYTDLARLRTLIDPWAAHVADEELTVLRTAEYEFRAQVAEQWRSGRVFLLGDAAHLTPPFIGQGMGAGLRDAANLSWKLAGVLRGELPGDVLDTYQAERKPHATAMVRLAIGLGRAMTDGGRLGDLLRELVAPRLQLLPGVRARVLDSATPRLSAGPLVRRSLRSGPLPGRLCPNALVDGQRRLDEVAPDQFLLVSRQPFTGQQRDTVERRGAVPLQVRAGEPLERWLRRGRAGAVVVRPDGTVLAADRTVAAVLPHLPSFRVPATTRPALRVG
ncbi:bifunctional 3-(3-hydroxy-phenyl)propionate/3-hydroxycinnamic acid hydroxylase [Modestobacter sp. I12A-02628]|uniref:Bifunctional 3-(3-hydroxy-phenyl)propionate/3-hydroxycinnamic acid hydroxylase n=1 Tax=Goekera deserti TaxID=2497753 RepID=A0A7K3WF92_9ACTN|nr:bifunctional 3-(3-hydroxy-phenyl)propionate/3-hydroxycinnamic acid hydroxylase [Goekera deserti]MPR00027.1 bifunctional 3-(3-hydroxy-phenyl)propionate/3-hydroxycinnamic acid hydroxylase [Goekera deserti]NDI49806.1 bifunctional 3-(3-hydroxy-phenyl)propionate/3-hydroxycinnamic acid hydroxylase [Goekera deserti]NEL55168.1 bifunctional 3-(3-hydroxy-phenyl)propionate/3-hydroxycinnamic acid hydroxylase [Goekera deserti]